MLELKIEELTNAILENAKQVKRVADYLERSQTQVEMEISEIVKEAVKEVEELDKVDEKEVEYEIEPGQIDEEEESAKKVEEVKKDKKDKKDKPLSEEAMHKKAQDLILELFADIPDEVFGEIEKKIDAILAEQGMAKASSPPRDAKELIEELEALKIHAQELIENKKVVKEISKDDFLADINSFLDSEHADLTDRKILFRKKLNVFGADKASSLKPEQYHDFLVAIGVIE